MRSLGATRTELFIMVVLEGLIIAIIGYVAGILMSRLGIQILDSLIQTNYRYDLDVLSGMQEEGFLLIASLVLGVLAAFLPALNAWRTDIAETLSS